MKLPGRDRHENVFIQLLHEQALTMQEATRALQRFLKTGDEEEATLIERCEKEGDELRRILIDELHKTFVTPFDREDIYQLSLYLDDVLDYTYTTVEELRVLQVQPDAHLAHMAMRLNEAADELVLAMERLTRNPMVALDHARRAKGRENQVERIYRQAVAELFRGPEDVHHVMEMLRIREVYRHISNAADRADHAANVIGSIIVKMT
ncbi:MAG: DUF47 family protein [Anaerolineae bacterium]|nr:DUF47 family protein [Caldilineales bacterium]MCX7852668.1 DUF47 family protein [Caldilineales bacterium]MDW8270164.1 DUF47 family protein [Anaerolineae bacterium]